MMYYYDTGKLGKKKFRNCYEARQTSVLCYIVGIFWPSGRPHTTIDFEMSVVEQLTNINGSC